MTTLFRGVTHTGVFARTRLDALARGAIVIPNQIQNLGACAGAGTAQSETYTRVSLCASVNELWSGSRAEAYSSQNVLVTYILV